MLTRGILRVASVTTGISGIVTSDGTKVDVYTSDGVLLRSGATNANALEGLGRGVYIVGGRKVVKN